MEEFHKDGGLEKRQGGKVDALLEMTVPLIRHDSSWTQMSSTFSSIQSLLYCFPQEALSRWG